MKKFALGLLLAGLSIPALAAAPAKAAPAPSASGSNFGGAISEGQIEVGGLFAWIKSDLADIGIVVANGGYMYTDNLEFKLAWTGILGDASGGLVTPGVDWFFKNLDLPVIPYAGGGFSLSYGDLEDANSFELHVGMKQFLTERIALDYRLSHNEPTDSAVDGLDIFLIGFAYYL